MERVETTECVIGAGVAGLTVAHALTAKGRSPLVLDKGRTPGGRMATRRFEGGLFDHGLPAIESGTESDRLITGGVSAGILKAAETGGRTVHYSPTGLSALGKHLGSTLDLRLQARVGAARREGDSVVLPVENGDGEDFEVEVTGRLYVTAPLPQAQEMAGGLFGEALTSLANPYSPCLVGLAVLESESNLPGGALLRELEGPDFERLVLEFLKFPDRSPGLSLRATPEASERLFDSEQEEQEAFFRQGFAELGIELGEGRLQVKEWRYSKPAAGLAESHLRTKVGEVEVFVVGDSFAAGAGTAVESALTSAAAAVASA